ncbi:MAG TPA: hypothetical protein VN345_06155, partial [Blastocatellia bacterium]|nr:hypothetical protein [Blastocatellia bacterium]
GQDPMDARKRAGKDSGAEDDDANDPDRLRSSQVAPKPVCYFLDLNEENAGERTMHVLVNEAEFDEDTLRALARHLFDRYPQPMALKILLATNEDVLAELQGAWLRGKKPSESHPYATIYRNKQGGTLRYKLPGTDFKAIEIVGGNR